MATLDPAIGYDWQNWSMINGLFSRLVDYKFGSTEIVPSLAKSWTLSPDGLVYTFTLDPSAKFTNGRKVVAADIKYSIERAVDPKTQGPGGGFFHSIVGQDKMAAGTATTMLGHRDARRRDGEVHPDPARRHLLQRAGAQLLLRGAEGGRRGRGRRLRQEAGRLGRLQARRMGDGPAPRLLPQRRLLPRAAQARRVPGRDRPGAAGRRAAPAEGRSGHRRRRHSAGQISRDEERSRREGHDRRPRPVRDQLHHHQHDQEALRRPARPPGAQHGDQQGPDRPHHQRTGHAGDTGTAAPDAGLRQRLQGLSLTTSPRPSSSSPTPG